jgi:hypothetical protein
MSEVGSESWCDGWVMYGEEGTRWAFTRKDALSMNEMPATEMSQYAKRSALRTQVGEEAQALDGITMTAAKLPIDALTETPSTLQHLATS